MNHAHQVWPGHMHCRVNDEAGDVDPLLHIAAVDHLAVLVDQDQVGRLHPLEEHPITVDQEMMLRPRHTQGEVGVDQVGHAKMCDQSIQRGQFATSLPFDGTDSFRLVHEYSF
ncbi:hypothetical protein D9M68_831870 [compost metagenome]